MTGRACSKSTPQENSRPAISSSANTALRRSDNSIIARDHSSCVRTMRTPALEPSLRGFTTSGRLSDPGNKGNVPPAKSNVSHDGVGRPSAESNFLVRCLSIASALERTSLPV